MVHALESLKRTVKTVETEHASIASLKINGKSKGLMALFATHPDLDNRIAALRVMARA